MLAMLTAMRGADVRICVVWMKKIIKQKKKTSKLVCQFYVRKDLCINQPFIVDEGVTEIDE